jgi:hexosaminidase
MTGQDILDLDAYCRERHVELVPNQNAFGHMHRWLTLDDYAHLAETHGEFPVPWGVHQGPFSLAPGHPGSMALVRELFDELLPHFSSRLFNVGADETHDIGHGQSRELVEQLRRRPGLSQLPAETV